MSFYHIHQLEEDYDYGYVEASTDGGSSYNPTPVFSITGNEGDWTRAQADLSSYVGQTDVRIRFRLESDFSIVADGWYIDDVRIAEVPSAITLSTVTTEVNRVDIQWTENSDSNFKTYRIYRSMSSNLNWQTARLLMEITDASTTNYSDISVSQKTHYYYQIMVINSNELHTLSNEINPLTPSGASFPFLDDAEGSASLWLADGPWAISSYASVSPTNSYSDSPGTNYAPSINKSLTTTAPIDLTGTTNPVFEYSHSYVLSGGDSCNVEISTNDAVSWISLSTYSGDSSGWLRGRHDLSSYTSSPITRLRFRITSDSGSVADGWHVDDIALTEAPAMIAAPILDNVQAHSIRLTWAASSDPLFSHYAIYRSTSTGVGINDTLVTNITDVSTVTFTDTGLALDSDYYYRVYAVNTYGIHSPDSTLESTARTLPHMAPYSEDFESDLYGWNIQGSWTTTTESAHSGSMSLTDSPGTVYSNSIASSWAQTSVDLTGTQWPVLTFWDWYDIADTGSDWAWVEISPNGSTWYRRYNVRGARTNWMENTIDLSEWKDEDDLQIRFWLSTDGSVTADGWHIDDVSVTDHMSSGLTYPLKDTFEQGTSNWLASAWVDETNTTYAGTHAVLSTPAPTLPYATLHSIVLNSSLDLSSAVNPQMAYWLKGRLDYKSYYRAQASSDGGKTWGDLDTLNYSWNTNNWIHRQVSLSSYTGTNVRFRLIVWSDGSYNPAAYVYADNVVIENQPAGVIMDPPVPYLKSVDLSWAVSELGADFQRYEIYRSIDATVTWDDTLIGSFSDTNDISMTDSNLSIGATYYYGVFVVNTNDTYSSVSSRNATTVPLSLPLTDPMENMDNWDATGNWGVDTSQKHGGSASISDSPGVDYGNSENSYILTAVDLTSAVWPVLTFWDRHDLPTSGDWAWVEISTDGSHWGSYYNVLGTRTEWQKQQIDLSPWIGQANVRIRFYLQTDGSTTADGWYIDDVSIAEHTPVGLAYPFKETFEHGISNWLTAGWNIETNGAYADAQCVRGNPASTLPYATYMVMTMADSFDMSTATNAQMTYWLQGRLDYKSYYRAQTSSDGGKTWGDIDSLNYSWNTNNWTRRQLNLSSYTGTNVRFRLIIWSDGSYNPAAYAYVDNLVMENQPAGVIMDPPVPYLKSVDLSWAVSELGADFQRYEIYRSIDATVTWDDTLIGSFSDTNDISMTDSNRSIGATYYYGVFVVNTNDTYSSVSSRSATTVPLSLPLTDPMENMDNWDATGNWGVDTSQKHGGSASISDSPGVDYGNSENSYILTAVDLTSAVWPVLTFWDRHDLPTSGDWAWVEISTDGSHWGSYYNVLGTRTEWQKQQIDLSPWIGQANVRIRFYLQTDGSTTADGWYIDDVSIAEHTPVGLAYPFKETFEHGISNWLTAGWNIETNGAYADAQCVRGNPASTLPYATYMVMTMADSFDMSTATNAQMTYWLQGRLDYKSYYRAQASSDGGKTWGDIDSLNYSWNTNNWTRRQLNLSSYTGTNVRFRLIIWSDGSYNPAAYVYVDNLVIEDQPIPVVLSVPDQITVSSMRINWTAYAGGDFKEYRLYQSTASGVDEADTLLGTFTNISSTTFTNTGLSAKTMYYYKVFVYNTNSTSSGSSEASARTIGVPLGWSDDFESANTDWTFTGDWGRHSGESHSGTTSLSDSPGVYNPSMNTWAQTAVDLSSAQWPVLRFWDRHDLPTSGDWAYVEISQDGSAWTRVYNVLGTRTSWREQSIDLSQWKGQGNVFIRFRLQTDGSTSADGWYIDDVSIEDQGTPSLEYPFYDDFEANMDNWLHSSWNISTNAYDGEQSARNTEGPTLPYGTTLWLCPTGSFDLTTSTDPQLTWFIKGTLNYKSYYRMQVSINGGQSWTDLDSQNYTWSSGWIKKQVSMSAYKTNDVRLRATVWSDGSQNPIADMCIDNFGLGEPEPGAPTLESPLNLESMPMVRPTLVVNNAIDNQSDSLTYEFEVYDDVGLSSLVANVPVIASGDTQTQWTVDTDLTDGIQYWWRCRADDGTTNGEWMVTGTFFINQINQAPNMVNVQGPPPASILHNTSYALYWYPTTDPDPGDTVDYYHVQVDDDELFGSPAINDSNLVISGTASGSSWVISMPLSALSGNGNLIENENYHWRVRAIDNWGKASLWSTTAVWFVYGTPPPDMLAFGAGGGGVFDMQFDRSGTGVQFEFTPTLDPPDWQPVGDVQYGTNVTLNVETNPAGFYRSVTK